ncbi:MAG: chromate transporter [Acetobacteraceae bacterium]|nr:chromate transporter [Acetobacteraceae bacterium]
MSELAALASLYAQISLVAVGGGTTVLPEMQRQVVSVHRWMTAQEFAALYALAQAAPGPNILVSTLVGWRVAGLPGALVATGSFCAPSSLLSYFVSGAWYRFRHARWRRVVQAGLTPVTAGLVLAGATLLTKATSTNWRYAALTGLVTLLLVITRLSPLPLLALGACLGASGWLL